MQLKSDLVLLAEATMGTINADLAEKYGIVFAFLEANRDFAQRGGARNFGEPDYVEHYAQSFANARNPRLPKMPATVADEMVAVILESFFEVSPASIDDACRHHKMAMGAENIIGDLLERYVAQTLEPKGWVWCSGSLTKDIDFICGQSKGEWLALQVKNRDNSENNASKRVRAGTAIRHWFRTFSKRKGDNWDNFPLDAGPDLGEDGFRAFVKGYLRDLRS